MADTPLNAWRRLPLSRPGAAQGLARAAALLETAEQRRAPTISWSTLPAPALVLGRAAQDPQLDWQEARRAGISVHRRASGGGAVLWDEGLLALDIALPPDHELVDVDVVRSYAWLGDVVAGALTDLGVVGVELVEIEAARSRPRPEGILAAACYGSLSPFEVTIAGRKVLGLSQVRRRRGTLLQAGLLLDHEPRLLARLLRGSQADAGRLGAAITGLRAHAPAITAERLAEAVDRSVAERVGARLGAGSLDESERELEMWLATERFAPIDGSGGERARPPR